LTQEHQPRAESARRNPPVRIRTTVLRRVVRLCLALGAAGCSRRESTPEPYDHLRTQLFAEAAEALAEGKDAAARVLLERLSGIMSNEHGDACRLLIQRVQDRAFLKAFNTALHKGDLGAARQIVVREERTRGGSPAVTAAREVLDELNAFLAAVASPPQTEPELERLCARIPTLMKSSPTCRRWVENIRTEARRRREEEERRALEDLALRFDRAVLQQSGERSELSAQILARCKHESVRRLAQRLASGRVAEAIAPVREASTSRERWIRTFSAAMLLDARPGIGDAAWKQLLRAFQPDPSPAPGLCNRWLAAEKALLGGDRVRAARLTRSVCTEFAPASLFLGPRIEALVMKRDQFQARPWRAVCPSIPDALNALLQMDRAGTAKAGRSRTRRPR